MNRSRALIAVAVLLAGGGVGWAYTSLRAESLSDRESRVAALSNDAKQQLLAKYDRFRQLSSSEKHRLRELQQTIDADPQRDELLGTLDRYHAWLQNLSAAQRAELNALDGAARLAKIRELKTERPSPRMPFYRPLSQPDRDLVRAWVERQAVQNVPADKREELAKLPEEERRRLLVRQFMQRVQPFDQNRRPSFAAFGEFKSLLDQLSEQARNDFNQAEGAQKLGLLSGWIMQAFGMSVGEEQLRQFFARDLNESERQRLLSLPGDEMQRELRRMYFRGSGREFNMGPPRFDGPGRPPQSKDGAFPNGPRGPGRKNDK